MSFKLTKSHVLSSYAPLTTGDRQAFFKNSILPSNIKWTIVGQNSLSGTRHSIEDHAAASFDRIAPKLTEPIKFIIRRVIVDAEPSEDGWWASVELLGEATTKTGEPYDNEYIWLTRYNDDGRIVEIRTYFDSLLSERVLEMEVPGE